jgi:hypothetical protein
MVVTPEAKAIMAETAAKAGLVPPLVLQRRVALVSLDEG